MLIRLPTVTEATFGLALELYDDEATGLYREALRLTNGHVYAVTFRDTVAVRGRLTALFRRVRNSRIRDELLPRRRGDYSLLKTFRTELLAIRQAAHRGVFGPPGEGMVLTSPLAGMLSQLFVDHVTTPNELGHPSATETEAMAHLLTAVVRGLNWFVLDESPNASVRKGLFRTPEPERPRPVAGSVYERQVRDQGPGITIAADTWHSNSRRGSGITIAADTWRSNSRRGDGRRVRWQLHPDSSSSEDGPDAAEGNAGVARGRRGRASIASRTRSSGVPGRLMSSIRRRVVPRRQPAHVNAARGSGENANSPISSGEESDGP